MPSPRNAARGSRDDKGPSFRRRPGGEPRRGRRRARGRARCEDCRWRAVPGPDAVMRLARPPRSSTSAGSWACRICSARTRPCWRACRAGNAIAHLGHRVMTQAGRGRPGAADGSARPGRAGRAGRADRVAGLPGGVLGSPRWPSPACPATSGGSPSLPSSSPRTRGPIGLRLLAHNAEQWLATHVNADPRPSPATAGHNLPARKTRERNVARQGLAIL